VDACDSFQSRGFAAGSGSRELILDDLLVGEVWLASGQSNMVWILGKTLDAGKEIAASANASLHRFTVATAQAGNPKGEWVIALPETSGQFSAAAYYFAKTTHESLDVQVGVIVSAVNSSQPTVPKPPSRKRPVRTGLGTGRMPPSMVRKSWFHPLPSRRRRQFNTRGPATPSRTFGE